MGTGVTHRYCLVDLCSRRLGSARATSATGEGICYFTRIPGSGDVMNHRIVMGALVALLFVTMAVLSFVRGETLMAVVLGLGGVAFTVRTMLAACSSYCLNSSLCFVPVWRHIHW